MRSIAIEHEGVPVEGARWYTETMYQASAGLAHLAARYHIPLDREHVLGHQDLPGLTPTVSPECTTTSARTGTGNTTAGDHHPQRTVDRHE